MLFSMVNFSFILIFAKKEKRIDTGLYGEEYKKIRHLLINYHKGSFFIPLEKIKSGSTHQEKE